MTEKWLIGKPWTVLQTEFESFLMMGDEVNMMTCLPFSGAHKLPTNGQVLKLYFAIRNSDKFSLMPSSKLSEMVCNLTLKYWTMANIITVDFRTVKARMVKLLSLYERLVKNKTMMNPAQVKQREGFVDNMEKLFDIASPQAEQ